MTMSKIIFGYDVGGFFCFCGFFFFVGVLF